MATACGSSAVFSGYMYTLQQTNSRIVDTYFDDIYFRVMKKAKDYKKELFKMVNADICKDEMKKLREQRKKELKKSNKTQTPPKEQTPSKHKKKNKK